MVDRRAQPIELRRALVEYGIDLIAFAEGRCVNRPLSLEDHHKPRLSVPRHYVQITQLPVRVVLHDELLRDLTTWDSPKPLRPPPRANAQDVAECAGRGWPRGGGTQEGSLVSDGRDNLGGHIKEVAARNKRSGDRAAPIVERAHVDESPRGCRIDSRGESDLQIARSNRPQHRLGSAEVERT